MRDIRCSRHCTCSSAFRLVVSLATRIKRIKRQRKQEAQQEWQRKQEEALQEWLDDIFPNSEEIHHVTCSHN